MYLCSNTTEHIWSGKYDRKKIIDAETGNCTGNCDSRIDNDKEEIITVAKNFFFTIVTNYSIQSLNYEDYEDEGPWVQKLFS